MAQARLAGRRRANHGVPPPDRRPRKRRRAAIVALAAVLVAGGLYASAYLLTGRSTLARAIAWKESDIEDRHRFPSRPVRTSPPPSALPRAPAPRGLGEPFSAGQAGAARLDAFLADRATRAFLVLQGDRLVYERYFNGGSPTSLETSFSMAKSFLSTLVGIAIDEGAIGSVEDPITRYLPELAERDERFGRIRIRHLLTMSSGIRYVEGGRPWSDDAVTYYGVDLREVALERTRVEGPPGRQWHYNNFHPLLLGLVLERATRSRVADYMASRLWQPLGAEADASWSLDSEASGFEKMESGVNARARDFARFGALLLHEGAWNGRRIVSRAWARAATRADARGDPADFYQYHWWVAPQAGPGRDPFLARGKYGQTIAVVPRHDAVIVRLGSDDAGVDWQRFALEVAERLGPRP